MSVREYRLSIGMEILKEMDKNEEFPVENVWALTDKMMEYFYEMGYEEELDLIDSSWLPTSEYWRNNLKSLRNELAKKKRFLEFIYSGHGFNGEWKFTDKSELHDKLRREAAGLGTRIDSYNDRLSSGNQRWKLELPMVESVPALPPYINS